MATDHNFRIKNGLSVSGTEVIDSNLNIGAGGAANSSYDLIVYSLARFQGTANFVNSTAIQVGGQTVLDSNRNLTSINNATAVSFLSTNGYWVGGTQRINGSGNLLNIGTYSGSGNLSIV